MKFMEKSDLFIAQEIIDFIPPDFMTQERALLKARLRHYKEAFDEILGSADPNEMA